MKHFVFTIIIFVCCFSGLAQDKSENPPIADPDCIFEGKLSWKEEIVRLKYFETELNKKKDFLGLIIFYLDNTVSENQLRTRLNKILYHIENTGKIDRARLRFVLADYYEERTCHFVVPKSESSEYKDCLISSGEDRFKNFKLLPNKSKK